MEQQGEAPLRFRVPAPVLSNAESRKTKLPLLRRKATFRQVMAFIGLLCFIVLFNFLFVAILSLPLGITVFIPVNMMLAMLAHTVVFATVGGRSAAAWISVWLRWHYERRQGWHELEPPTDEAPLLVLVEVIGVEANTTTANLEGEAA